MGFVRRFLVGGDFGILVYLVFLEDVFVLEFGVWVGVWIYEFREGLDMWVGKGLGGV